MAGFVVSFIAIGCSKRPANVKYSYGYHRADVLGALATVLIIWALLVWLLQEATVRIMHPELIEVKPLIMLYTSLAGFGCNCLNLFVLFCCCNEDKNDSENEDTHYEVDTIID